MKVRAPSELLVQHYYTVSCPKCGTDMMRVEEDGDDVIYCTMAVGMNPSVVEGRCELAGIRFEAPYELLTLKPVIK